MPPSQTIHFSDCDALCSQTCCAGSAQADYEPRAEIPIPAKRLRDPKTVQGILRHEDVRTTMQLYAQSDQESKLEAQGKFLEELLGDKAHLLPDTHPVNYRGLNRGLEKTGEIV